MDIIHSYKYHSCPLRFTTVLIDDSCLTLPLVGCEPMTLYLCSVHQCQGITCTFLSSPRHHFANMWLMPHIELASNGYMEYVYLCNSYHMVDVLRFSPIMYSIRFTISVKCQFSCIFINS